MLTIANVPRWFAGVPDGHARSGQWWNHSDQRPDALSYVELKHKDAMYADILHSQARVGFLQMLENWYCDRPIAYEPVEKLLISGELLAQCATGSTMSPGTTDDVVFERLKRACNTQTTVNYSRYLTFEGHNVSMNTAIVAFGLYQHARQHTRALDFCQAPAQ